MQMTFEGYEKKSVAICSRCKREKTDDTLKMCSSCRERNREQLKEFYRKHKERGLCRCGNTRSGSYLACDRCMEADILRVNKNPHRKWASGTLSRHRKSKYVVNITTDELAEIAKNCTCCKYCGTELNWKFGDKNRVVVMNSPSLDRIDNGNELSLENVQIICHKCNSRKYNDTEKEFIAFCNRVSKEFGSTIISYV